MIDVDSPPDDQFEQRILFIDHSKDDHYYAPEFNAAMDRLLSPTFCPTDGYRGVVCNAAQGLLKRQIVRPLENLCCAYVCSQTIVVTPQHAIFLELWELLGRSAYNDTIVSRRAQCVFHSPFVYAHREHLLTFMSLQIHR